VKIKRRAQVVLVCGVAIATMTISTLWAKIDAQKEAYYGLRTIREPYRSRIRSLIGLAMIQHKAITSSGFAVFTLKRVATDRMLRKIYVWQDLEGRTYVTTPLLSLDHWQMREGDAYVGKAEIVWVKIYRNANENTFSIER